MNGNIALSMEIGSAYALQVCLLQIPCLVLFSAVYGRWIDPEAIQDHIFSKSYGRAIRNITNLLSTHIPPMGYGHRHTLHLPPQLHVRRRQE